MTSFCHVLLINVDNTDDVLFDVFYFIFKNFVQVYFFRKSSDIVGVNVEY